MANAPTATAATPANAGGSNKSTPAPKVGIPASVKKWLPLVFFTLLVIIGIVLIASVAYSPEQKQAEKAMLLSMSANGDSRHIDTKPDHAIDYTGSGFTIHCVYRDGTEGVVGDKIHPCKNGPMFEQYVRDITGKANTVTYAYVFVRSI